MKHQNETAAAHHGGAWAGGGEVDPRRTAALPPALRARRERALAALRGEDAGPAAAIATSAMREIQALVSCPYSGRKGSIVVDVSHENPDGSRTVARIRAEIDTTWNLRS